MATIADPLALLPSEIILQVLEFAPSATLASLTRTSKAWHHFIDVEHQNAIYSSPLKTEYPHGAKDFNFLSSKSSFSKYFDNISSWKELCKRQTVLSRNWAAVEPETRESVLQVGRNRVWRFKPDFKRRFFLSTSHDGGVQVTSMDTGRIIWSLPRTEVRPYAHLEYQDGTAVWDRYGNALEVWKTDFFSDGIPGEFRRVAVINHEVETRGFQFAFDTLCVASSEGEGFVYDMLQTPPVLKTHISLREGAMGHVYQDADAVLFSMAEGGFDFYEKAGGGFLGTLDGIGCRKYRHIKHPAVRSPSLFDPNRYEPVRPPYPPSNPRRDRLTPLDLEFGPLSGVIQTPIEEDDWGAGMIDGGVFVGLSRGGRILVCPQWRQALKDKRLREEHDRMRAEDLQRREEEAKRRVEAEADSASSTNPPQATDGDTEGPGEGKASFSIAPPPPPNWTIIECEDNGAGFDLGGWLAIKDNRFLCEMAGRIHIISLAEDGDVYQGKPKRASWSMSTASSSELKSPVSFMGLYDDCVMSTFSILGWDSTVEAMGNDNQPIRRIFPTKAIRTISFSPATEGMPSLWQASSPQQERHLAQFMDLIPMLGGNVDGVDGDELVLSDDDDFQDFEEDEDEELPSPESLESDEDENEDTV